MRLALHLTILAHASGFYLPGVAPREYKDGESVELKVNKLTSTVTQLPYEYYSLPFCMPAGAETVAENLGEVLRGDKIMNSEYTLKMGIEESCQILCKKSLTPAESALFSSRINEDYRVTDMIVDNLPAATRVVEPATPTSPSRVITIYERGFPLGFKGASEIPGTTVGTNYLYNHLRFVFKYHMEASFEGSRIVGFEVEPFSVKHAYSGSFNGEAKGTAKLISCTSAKPVSHELPPQPVTGSTEVIFTYDVRWEYSEVKWASRWDVYLYATDSEIHWFSIINSLMIVLFLTGMLAMIMARTLHRDLRRYNDAETKEEAQEESGWKLVHGDVFRPPPRAGLLVVYLGTGVQVLGMTIMTMAFAVLGFLSPSNRGGLMSALLLLFVLMGVAAGFVSSIMYKAFKGTDWKLTTLKTAMMFPGIVASIFFILNLFIWGEKSSGAVPFTTLIALLCMWFGISVPLVFLGAYLGFRRPPIEYPTKTNLIPRRVPERPWYMHPIFCVLVGGVLPFGAVFIELFFILSSIWLHQYYYVFGFLLVVLLILIITCAEITIVMCYFQLCSEDYHWWWRAFLTSGCSGVYLFIYSIVYMFTKMTMSRGVSIMLYIGYMLIASYSFCILTGTVGFFAAWFFVRSIYAAVKVE